MLAEVRNSSAHLGQPVSEGQKLQASCSSEGFLCPDFSRANCTWACQMDAPQPDCWMAKNDPNATGWLFFTSWCWRHDQRFIRPFGDCCWALPLQSLLFGTPQIWFICIFHSSATLPTMCNVHQSNTAQFQISWDLQQDLGYDALLMCTCSPAHWLKMQKVSYV